MASVQATPSHGRLGLTPQRLVDPYLWALVTLATLVMGSALAGIGRDLGAFRDLTPGHWVLMAGLMVSSYLILTHLILFDWRGQRVALGPDEVLVFLALAALPAPAVILFAVPPMLLYQITTRRPFLRAASNVAVVTLASGTGVAAHALLALYVPPLAAIGGAIVAYTLATHTLVSSVFALREGARVLDVFRERFLVPTALHVTLGVSGGVAILVLWDFHPVAVAALLPFAWLAEHNAELVGRAAREELVHQRLAETTRALVGERDLDRVAERVLSACGDLFQGGRAALVVSEDGKERRWTRDFEGGWNPDATPLAASLVGVDGVTLGAIVVHPSRRLNRSYEPVDERLLRIVAGDAASALANARALRALDAAQRALITQRVARPLVRRIVRGLMVETRSDALVLLRLGEQLAQGLEGRAIEDATRAYADMGLGQLELATERGERYEFVGTQLLEEVAGARATTCYLALGFLCGAVGRAHGTQARGTETSCRSRGDTECRFALHAGKSTP